MAASSRPVEENDDDYYQGPSLFHKRMVQEMDDCLKSSLRRRAQRVERHVNALFSGGASGAKSSDSRPSRSVASQAVETQTLQSSFAATTAVAEVISKAYRKAAICARKNNCNYGPSKAQTKLTDPPEKKEDLVKEAVTLNSTHQAFKQNVANRERQNVSLWSQLKTCEAIRDEMAADAARSAVTLRELEENPSLADKIFKERLDARRARVLKLRKDVEDSERKAADYKALAMKQQAFLQQARSIQDLGCNSLKKHPAGEVFVELRPAPVEDITSYQFDIGSQFANPYVVDSWPFEPNTLAQRTMHQRKDEDSLMPVEEVTDEEDDDDEEIDSGVEEESFEPASARSV